MNADIEGLRKIVRDAIPDAQILTGYGSDLIEFLASANIVKKTQAFISYAGLEPRESTPAGWSIVKARQYSIFLRSETSAANKDAGYHDYIALEDALDGATFRHEGVPEPEARTRKISVTSSGSLALVSGYDAFEITINLQ